MVMDPNRRYNPTDSRKFRREDDLYLSNANLFISNNNNPFLISPYSPPPNYVRQLAFNQLSSIIATFIGDISSIINLNTFTLSISTIEPIPSDNTITISSGNLFLNETEKIELNAPLINMMGSTFNVEPSSFFNYIFSENLDVSIANISSLSVSTLSILFETINDLQVNSTLNASTIIALNETVNDLKVNSTLDASTITGLNATINDLYVNSTLTVSTMIGRNIEFETLYGSTIISQKVSTFELVFSSLCMIPSTISTLGTPTSSILICLDGSYWKIPIEKA